jgi:chromosomal replication initiation ATPase DnaA
MRRQSVASPDVDGPQKSEPALRQLILDLARDPAYELENFLVSPSNAEAFRLLDRWPDWPTHMLVLTGPPGSGKSHLASIWAQHSGARIVRPGEAIDPMALAGRGAVLLEDCDRSERADAGFFHLINLMKDEGGWLLLTARTPPNQWRIQTPDLLSRLRLAATTRIGRPEPDLVQAVLVKLFADRQIRIEEDVVRYATLHLEQSLEAATRFVAAVDDAALSSGRRITRALASATIALMNREE